MLRISIVPDWRRLSGGLGRVVVTARLAAERLDTRRRVQQTLISQCRLYSQYMLTIASQLDVMNRLGRAMADSTRSRILMGLLEQPGYPAQIAKDLELTRTNVSNHLACLRDCGIVVAEPEGRQTRYEIADPHLTIALNNLLKVTLTVDASAPCLDPYCGVEGCGGRA